MQNSDEQLKKRLLELSDRADTQHRVTFSDFLTLDEQATFNTIIHSKNAMLQGGYLAAERKVACFGLDYDESATHISPIECVKIQPVAQKFADTLSHRDFLGTLMGLGIRRETLGDIIIYENTGYVFCLNKMSGYIIENIERVRHTSVKCMKVDAPPVESVALPEKQLLIVASPRLDSLIAAVYKLSRADSQELFEQGRVYIDGRQTNNTSYLAKENDIISVRGFGRFMFCEIIGETKKSRLRINVRVF